MSEGLQMEFDRYTVRATEHGPALYEWYKVTNHLDPGTEIEDPISTMRSLLEAEGHVVNGIVGDQATIREALQGQPSSVLKQFLDRKGQPAPVKPRIWVCGHEIEPFESLWTWENYDNL